MKVMIAQKEKVIARVVMLMICLLAVLWVDKNSIVFVQAEEVAKVITDSAKVRSEASTSGTQVASIQKGTSITIIEEVKDAAGTAWYQVNVDGKKGYIRADLVQKGSAETSTTQTANVAASDKKEGTILKDSVRVRKEANTSADVVATLGKGVALKIAGETKGADGKTWYSVSFTYQSKSVEGFVRSDFITFEALPEEEPEETEILGSTGGAIAGEGDEGTTAEPMTESEVPTEPQEEQPAKQTVEYQLLNVEEIPEVPAGYTEVELSWNEESIRSWKNGSYYIFYARNSEGSEGWYRFDSEEATYQRYDPTTEAVKSGGSTVQMIIIIALAIVVVILIILVTMLFLKLNDYKQDEFIDDDDDDDDDDNEYVKREKAKKTWRSLNFMHSDDDDDDDEDEDDDEYYEDDEDEEEYIPVRPIKRPIPQGQTAVRRPAPQGREPVRRPAPQGQAPVRRPAPQGGEPVRRPIPPQGGESVRRPAPQGAEPIRRAPQGQTPVRRPAPQDAEPVRRAPQGQAPVRRPAPQGGQPARRPTPQGNRPRDFDN